MAITKKFLKTKPLCKVTFAISAPEANEITLVGDFNEWNTVANPLKKLKNGTFKTILDLDVKKSYQYRYIVDGSYVNDDEAEALIFNDFANTENCIVTL